MMEQDKCKEEMEMPQIEMPQMMPQMPQMAPQMQMPQMQMPQMMPQMPMQAPMVCCPILMGMQCPMLYGQGMGFPSASMYQPQMPGAFSTYPSSAYPGMFSPAMGMQY